MMIHLFNLRTNSKDSHVDNLAYLKYRDFCAQSFDFLVEYKTRKYKTFSNYEDLKQDGRIALMLALKSYKPGKGDFIFWANQYIKTRLSREANRHSTIKIPIKKARTMKPFKVAMSSIHERDSTDLDPFEIIHGEQLKKKIHDAITKMPESYQLVLQMHFELNGFNGLSTTKICQRLKITRSNCIKLLNQAKSALKELLSEEFASL